MRQTLSSFILLLTLAACGGPSQDHAKTEEKKEAAATTGSAYTIDTTATSVQWRATHKGGFAPRFGNIKVADGSLNIENGTLTGGSFEVNMNTLVTDPASVTEKDKKSTELDKHLKSPDFFDVAKYPNAKFVITGVAPYDSVKGKSLLAGATHLISGNLTLKDSTLNITFPAQIAVNENDVTANAKFVIDRTAWGINYKTEGSPENWMISKEIEIGFQLKAVK
ncbi:Polyisoprenoid-binding protein YceI [Chitinophaga sp. CF118]|uniref:YceI family protein n=1 Tax=Chitinophaga sp. CF118 TaxID=1884367 RepID=UPI0008F35EBD|nr:YceI family protein [Chitinophaga sp. CF118]SFE60866.1 Polyisoprenoid-binding protein YceI [Chitinophaga sp. CF118]